MIKFGDPAFSFTDPAAGDNQIESGRVVVDKFIDNYETTDELQTRLRDDVGNETDTAIAIAGTLTLVHVTMGVSTAFGPDGLNYGEAFTLQDGLGHYADILPMDEEFALDADDKGVGPFLMNRQQDPSLTDKNVLLDFNTRVKPGQTVSGWIPFVTTTDHSKLEFGFSSSWGDGVVDLTSDQ